MKTFRRLALSLVLAALGALPIQAAVTQLPPLPPLPASPVATFRQLLAQAPADREATLTARPVAQQAALRARLAEYDALPAPDREQRLKATDLYWHMQQLLKRAPQERPPLIAAAPEDLRGILEERLRLWDNLPAPDRDALLQHERAIRYFARLRQVQPPPLPPGTQLTGAPSVPLRVQADLGSLENLSPAQRDTIQRQWRQFFEAPTPRSERTLQAMEQGERRDMERVLARFRLLSADQRQTCIDAFARFATLPAAERAAFLRKAERWESLPPDERAAWRKLVDKLPILPPLPTDGTPPPLPPVQKSTRLARETGTPNN